MVGRKKKNQGNKNTQDNTAGKPVEPNSKKEDRGRSNSKNTTKVSGSEVSGVQNKDVKDLTKQYKSNDLEKGVNMHVQSNTNEQPYKAELRNSQVQRNCIQQGQGVSSSSSGLSLSKNQTNNDDYWSDTKNDAEFQTLKHFSKDSKHFSEDSKDFSEDSSQIKHTDNLSFREYCNFLESCHNYVKVTEIESDLFLLPKEYSLAHCVAEDMAMGSGIAVHFKREFKSVDELYAQKQKRGGLAVLEDNGRFIYYLVTKQISNGKPTLETLFSSLIKMKVHIEKFHVKKVAMPRIGCGLDRLEWTDVKPMLEYIFKNTDVMITVCNFQQPAEDTSQSAQTSKPSKCYVKHVGYPLVQIEYGTIVIYLGCEDGNVSDEIKTLDNKFKFLDRYKSAQKCVGDIITSYVFNYSYLLCGFIIKKSHKDEFNFINFQRCVVALDKYNRKKENKYGYVGIEAFSTDDDLIMAKIANLLKYGLHNVEVYICWPEGPKEFPSEY